MPWWLAFALDWFPAAVVALVATWWLDLPLGATVLVFLLVVAATKLGQRVVRAVRGTGGAPPAGGKLG